MYGSVGSALPNHLRCSSVKVPDVVTAAGTVSLSVTTPAAFGSAVVLVITVTPVVVLVVASACTIGLV